MKNKNKGKHALLSPSNTRRWLSCPPSVQLTKTISKHELHELEVLDWIDGKTDLNLTTSGLIRVNHIDAILRLIKKGIIKKMPSGDGHKKYERVKF